MAARICSNIALLVAVMLAHGALAQDQLDLTTAGKAILQSRIADNSACRMTAPG